MTTAATIHPPRLAAPLALFFALFFAVPLVLLLGVSLQAGEAGGYGLSQYARFFADGLGARVLSRTLLIGLETTIACLLLGYPLALIYRNAPPWGRSVITLIVLLPLLTSVVVRTFAWIVILGRQGLVNTTLQSLGLIDLPLKLLYTEGGLIVALTQVQLPLMFLPLAGTLARIPPNLEDASAALGAGAWRTFFRVTLPLSIPGALAGCTLTFAAAVTAFITQTLVGGGQMLLMPSYIYQQAISLQNWPFAAAISMVFLAAVLAILALIAALGRLAKGVAHV
ncbi:MAG: ABC transporter permease [Acetobacteraceae bacterium]|nr:ABC transporter permease [Pseudomonadota bacterium]